jgi:hypothetical protein
VGFVPEALLEVLQVAENNMPPLPKLPPLPRRIARYCPLLPAIARYCPLANSRLTVNVRILR